MAANTGTAIFSDTGRLHLPVVTPLRTPAIERSK